MTVYLVGAGPGDPALLTIRAAQLLSAADVVVHDRLVDAAVLARCPVSAEIIDVGKGRGEESASQAEINSILVARGQRGGVVVRLKGGDPYVFGRGGEEAEELQRHGIDYEVVPGVSSFSAVPAAAGVPLTMRGLSSSFLVVTGHDVDMLFDRTGSAALLAAETLVVLMGGDQRGVLAARLIAAGRSAQTPVLVVEKGTTPEQRAARVTLEELGGLDVDSPATIVIGDVAGLRLAAYEDRPLFGWRVVVTRAAAQASDFLVALAALGAVPVAMPTIQIAPPADLGSSLRDAIERLSVFEWVVFTSTNAVSRFFAEVRDARSLAGIRVAVLGDATAEAARAFGITADLVPLRFEAEGLVEAFPRPLADAKRVMIPRADIGREVVSDGLRSLGWIVETPIAYSTVHATVTPEMLEAVRGADIITFASSSAVAGFLEAAGRDELPPVIASIGPSTTATLEKAGITVDVEASPHTTSGLVDAIAKFTKDRPRPWRSATRPLTP